MTASCLTQWYMMVAVELARHADAAITPKRLSQPPHIAIPCAQQCIGDLLSTVRHHAG
jgi:hypothetical protein